MTILETIEKLLKETSKITIDEDNKLRDTKCAILTNPSVLTFEHIKTVTEINNRLFPVYLTRDTGIYNVFLKNPPENKLVKDNSDKLWPKTPENP